MPPGYTSCIAGILAEVNAGECHRYEVSVMKRESQIETTRPGGLCQVLARTLLAIHYARYGPRHGDDRDLRDGCKQ